MMTSNKQIKIRKAVDIDLPQITDIYSAIHTEEEEGHAVIGWKRGIYPIRNTAYSALQREELFVLEDECEVVASAIINQTQVPEYSICRWKYAAPAEKVMVLHTLVVDPRKKGYGYGTAFVSFYEQYAQERNCPFLRMDTNAINLTARKLYAHLGYEEVGIVDCTFNGLSGVHLVCLEKKINL